MGGSRPGDLLARAAVAVLGLCACSGGGGSDGTGAATDSAGTTTAPTSDATSSTAGSQTGSTTTTTASTTTGSDSASTSGASGVKFDVMEGDLPCEGEDCNLCESEFEDFVDPIVKCTWDDEWVIMTPLVADIDQDLEPEILFTTQPKSGYDGDLVAIRGDDCSQVFRVPVPFGSRSQLAVGDLDDDGDVEIAGLATSSHKVVVVDHTGAKIAESVPALVTGATFTDGGPSFANLDGQGPPEIVYGGMALRLNGNTLDVLHNTPVESAKWGLLSAVADVDLDGKPEIVTGNRILDGMTGADETPAGVASFVAGHPAIAQFDPNTPEPEIVLISSKDGQPSLMRIYHPTTGNVIFGPFQFGSQRGGPPTVGDFDGDEQPEVAVAGNMDYVVFDLECDVMPLPAFCAEAGIRWRDPTQDLSSGSTGSTLFDFNGDGKVEVVYRDEVKLRIYDGATGDILSELPIVSGTILDNPVVADVDLDDHAELVVPSHISTEGIFVIEDPMDRWVAARTSWNQHTYHVTNVEDDLTIPAVEQKHWESWNSFRQQVAPNPLGKVPCKPAG